MAGKRGGTAALRQLTSCCLMASGLLLSTSAAAAAAATVRLTDDGDPSKPGSEPPQVKEQYPATLIAQLGSTVRLACPVYGSPRSLVSWTKDSDAVHQGWQRFHQQRGGAWLYITDIQQRDAGRYTCDATNGFGTATVSISLRVVPNTNNASLYDDVISGERQVTSGSAHDAGGSTSDGVTWTMSQMDDVTSEGDVDDDDVMLASLLCVGAAVCATSLTALVLLAARRRLTAGRRRRDKRPVVVPVSAARRLLAVTAAATPITAVARHDVPQPQQQQPRTATLWTAASHVSAMRLLFTGHQQTAGSWTAATDTGSFV